MSLPKRKVAFIHTSPAAVGPLMQFYGGAAPELEITSLLDDGLLRLLAEGEHAVARRRLAEMLGAASETYGAELAMITCSSVPKEMAESLGGDFDVPVLKIDYPMAREAVRAGRRVGVAATFRPTLVPTSRLLSEAAAEAGVEIEIVEEVVPEAYTALLANDTATHDRLLLDGVELLAEIALAFKRLGAAPSGDGERDGAARRELRPANQNRDDLGELVAIMILIRDRIESPAGAFQRGA